MAQGNVLLCLLLITSANLEWEPPQVYYIAPNKRFGFSVTI